LHEKPLWFMAPPATSAQPGVEVMVAVKVGETVNVVEMEKVGEIVGVCVMVGESVGEHTGVGVSGAEGEFFLHETKDTEAITQSAKISNLSLGIGTSVDLFEHMVMKNNLKVKMFLRGKESLPTPGLPGGVGEPAGWGNVYCGAPGALAIL
jgi:hypothetical protein